MYAKCFGSTDDKVYCETPGGDRLDLHYDEKNQPYLTRDGGSTKSYLNREYIENDDYMALVLAGIDRVQKRRRRNGGKDVMTFKA